jgi:hypothetical protein
MKNGQYRRCSKRHFESPLKTQKRLYFPDNKPINPLPRTPGGAVHCFEKGVSNV